MRYKKVFDNVDFDYPQCGGYEVYENKRNWSIRYYTNYQGSRTDVYYRVPKINFPQVQLLLTQMQQEEKFNKYKTRKGFLVE